MTHCMTNLYIRILLIIQTLYCITSCTSLTTQHQKIIYPIHQNWEVKGKAAIISQEEKSSFHLFWSNNNQLNEEKITASNLFGITLFKIHSRKNHATLVLKDEKYQSNNIDNLIRNITSLTFPFTKFKHYLTVNIQNSDKITYDDLSRPDSILFLSDESAYEHHCQLTYKQWDTVHQYTVPKKIELSCQDGLRFILSISSWKIL